MKKIIISYELDTNDIPTVVIAKENENGEIQVMHTIQKENGKVEIEIMSTVAYTSKKRKLN